MIERQEDGTYKIPAALRFLSTAHRVLPQAVPPISSMRPQKRADLRSFGWICGALSAPDSLDRYVVEFVTHARVRILAYIDRQGHVFSTDVPFEEPPTGDPQLSFALFSDGNTGDERRGCIRVRAQEDDPVIVARFIGRNDRFDILDSWYDFDKYGRDLSYDDAMARTYLAFVYRPSLGGAAIDGFGFSLVDASLAHMPLTRALPHIIQAVRDGSFDQMVRQPALVRLLTRWLVEISASRSGTLEEDALRLVRTTKYSDLYYVVVAQNQAAPWVQRYAWAVESALNRFKIIRDRLGDQAVSADLPTCIRFAGRFTDGMVEDVWNRVRSKATDRGHDGRVSTKWEAEQRDELDVPVVSDMLGEWDVRVALAQGIENLKTPYRTYAEFHVNCAEGAVAFFAHVPDAYVMPPTEWDEEKDAWRNRKAEETAACALNYARKLGLALAALAFGASERVNRVEYLAEYMDDGAEVNRSDSGSRFQEQWAKRRACQATFQRSQLEEALFGFAADGVDGDSTPGGNKVLSGLSLRQMLADIGAVYKAVGGTWSLPEVADISATGRKDPRDVFKAVVPTQLAQRRNDAPEILDGSLPLGLRARLGASYLSDLRITAESAHRRQAERIADAVDGASDDIEAIRMVRSLQQEQADPVDVNGSTRVMAALAEGSVARDDKNGLVNCYLGDDPYLRTLEEAQRLAKDDPHAAASVLCEALRKAEDSGAFSDDAEVVHRAFDTYASRLLYNLVRAGRVQFDGRAGADFGAADASKRVELVPDSLYLCYLEAEQLLEHTIDGSDEALRIGNKAIQLAPATAAGYRQLARALMLVGDVESAKDALRNALQVAVQPADVSVSYYQLGYVLWKAGDPQTGALCYLKSVSVSAYVALQVMAELRQLMQENDVKLVPTDELDDALKEADIPVAPSECVLDALLDGAAAATDAGAFPCARSLLALRLHYKPDDALANVAQSLHEE